MKLIIKNRIERQKLTKQAYYAEGVRRFGQDPLNWKYICPVCGHIASAQNYLNAGAPLTAIAFSCIGRWTNASQSIFDKNSNKTGPCNYSGGGLFDFNPVEIEDLGNYFNFAPTEPTP